jgi:glutamate racemase
MPSANLVLAMDPDRMPWGQLPAEEVISRLHLAVSAAEKRPLDAVVVPCNTASVVGLVSLRERLEPMVPVIGTVPAVKPVAASGAPFAVWATERTATSEYLAALIAEFAANRDVTCIGCEGLAEAIDAGDDDATAEAISAAAAATPRRCGTVVLACTHYPLVAEAIARALPTGTQLLDSRDAVVRQVLRRLPHAPHEVTPGAVAVLLSG